MKRIIKFILCYFLPLFLISVLLTYFYINSFTPSYQAWGGIELIRVSNSEKIRYEFDSCFKDRSYFDKLIKNEKKDIFINSLSNENKEFINNLNSFDISFVEAECPIIYIKYDNHSSTEAKNTADKIINLYFDYLKKYINANDEVKIIKTVKPGRPYYPNYRNMVSFCILMSFVISIMISLYIELYRDKKNGILTSLHYFSRISLQLVVYIIISVIMIYYSQYWFGRIFKFDRIYFGDSDWEIIFIVLLFISSILTGLAFLFWYNSKEYKKNIG